jgi:predicted amidophosphoribosyltransferase
MIGFIVMAAVAAVQAVGAHQIVKKTKELKYKLTGTEPTRCSRCGADVPGGNTFCGRCGARRS